MSRWFEIRNVPKPRGEVIAIWEQTDDDHALAFGAVDIEYPPVDEDDRNRRITGTDNADAIYSYLVHEIGEGEFSVLSEIADIPRIISDGLLHHLGKLSWGVGGTERPIPCVGTVYTKVVSKRTGSLPQPTFNEDARDNI